MNVEFQTVGYLFYGPGSSGLGASMNKLVLFVKTILMKHLWEVIMGVKLQNQGYKVQGISGF